MKSKKIISFLVLYLISNVFLQKKLTAQLTSEYVDKFSLSSCYTLGYKGEKYLWNATCFFVKVKSTIYLITNNHVVGGEKFIEEYKKNHKDSIPPKESFPDNLIVRVYDKYLNKYNNIEIPLKGKSNEKWINFYENDSFQNTILDVVAIRMHSYDYPKFSYCTILDSNNMNQDLNLIPGGELFVVGYPLDSGQYILYPLWKRGTIASEANFYQFGKSWFWIDATTRQGMSGSPVFFRGTPYPSMRHNIIQSSEPFSFLVGIYSAQNYESELGVVIRLEKIFAKLNEITN